MIKIEKGHTNNSYQTANSFYQEKIVNKFNHKLDYSLLKDFDFVPKLIQNTDKVVEWEWIKTKEKTFDKDILVQIANNFKTLHDSELKFPKSNVASRVKEYRRILKEKNINIDVLNKYYKRINLILKHSQNNRPLHNDLYEGNIIVDKNNKVYFVDWEYSSMGDKHFDLAYFICGSFLNKEQEEIFLNQYESYWEEYLIQQKILVYYLTILWLHAQDVMPFSDEYCIKKLEETVKEFDYLKQNNLFKR
ncbi:phosphotransferase [Mycoplasma sp. NEAQ87857]|uniref:phosphotransferase n=1 Tax=Mycoplasma sp. NEAQ87857 TaxID=2683967 RepID=UPI0013186D4A|nr:phosphotransferase [Mycoplasma sp. NEAQ87857]QGZ97961.1 phosphotransferase [Mycoplasma sp. NEAQ87857]